MSQQNIDQERAKKRADASFRAQVREVEGRKASKEYWAAQQEALDRIPKLRAARLAREAQDRVAKRTDAGKRTDAVATVARRAKG